MSLLKVTPGFLFFLKKKKSQNIVFIFTIRPLGVKQNKNKTDSKCRQGDRICFSSLTARSRGEAVAQEPLWPECVTACAWYGESAGPAMINCNLTTILYLYCLPLTRTCARTDAHKHTRARAHTRAHTLARSWTFLSPLSVPDIYPTKPLHPCHVSNFRDDIKNLKNKKKGYRTKRNTSDSSRGMSGGNLRLSSAAAGSLLSSLLFLASQDSFTAPLLFRSRARGFLLRPHEVN